MRKNMSFILIPKSLKVWTKSEAIGLGTFKCQASYTSQVYIIIGLYSLKGHMKVMNSREWTKLTLFSLSGSWDWLSFSLFLTQRLTLKLFNLICCEWLWSFSSYTLHLKLFIYIISIIHKASILRRLKPGLSVLFESGPIRTQVYLRTERACKQTNTCMLYWMGSTGGLSHKIITPITTESHNDYCGECGSCTKSEYVFDFEPSTSNEIGLLLKCKGVFLV